MLVNACETNLGLQGCILNNITVDISLSSALEVRVNVTSRGSDYKFTFELYDGEDLIFLPVTEDRNQDAGNLYCHREEYIYRSLKAWF